MITIIGLGAATQLPPIPDELRQLPWYARTQHHPALEGVTLTGTFDAVLDSPAAAQQIVTQLLALPGDVVYLVPGHPLLADASVRLLGVQSPHQFTLAASFFPNEKWHMAVGVMPATAGVQYCDALDLLPQVDTRDSWATFHAKFPYAHPVAPLPVHPGSAAWLTNVHSVQLLQQVVLQLQQTYVPSHPVAVVHADGHVQHGTLIDATVLVREFPVTLYLAAAEPLANQRSADGIAYVITRLLGPGGCPWDHEQTPQSLRRTLLEETYEAIDALDRGDDASLLEELGDVLLNILMQAEMARQAGRFSMGDVYTQVTAKFIRRHPHVFGDVSAADSEAVLQNWYRIKQSEAGSATPKSPVAGVPLALPALTATMALLNKSKRHGVTITDPVAQPLTADQLGAQLFDLATSAMLHDIDAEAALREVNARYRRRVDALFARDQHLQGQTQELWHDADRDA